MLGTSIGSNIKFPSHFPDDWSHRFAKMIGRIK